MRGGWAWVSDMVVIIGGLAMLLALAVLAIVFIYSGWKVAMGLMASVFVVGLAASIMIGLIFGPDNGFIYIVATIGLIPAGYLLVREVIQLYSLLG